MLRGFLRCFLPRVIAVAILTTCSATAQNLTPPPSPDLRATRYGLKIDLLPEKHRFDAEARLVFKNAGTSAVQSVPLMLYRLLTVQAVTDETGRALPFRQNIVAMADEEFWQVNEVRVELAVPVAAGGNATVILKYGGTIAGYREVMPYVRDSISEDYTLFRAETMPYPVLGTAAYVNWRKVYRSPFTYDVRATVPAGYSVACGGAPVNSNAASDRVTFTCVTKKPEPQLNIAVARFSVADDAANGLRVCAMPQDANAAPNVLREMKRALEFFDGYFGPVKGARGITVIELPDGWGSYTGDGFVFQTAAAFKDPKQINELYHEVAHRWNAVADPNLQRTRWFDEAFASYFEALALKSLVSEEAFREDMKQARDSFVRAAKRDADAAAVPIADYGKHEMGRYSYNKGAWSLYVLHQAIGDAAFRRAMTDFFREYQSKPATFDDFRRVVERVSGRNLEAYFDEWITGSESSRLLLSDASVEQMAERYGAKGTADAAARH